ncbi:hypothetical protein AAG570_002420 [Ranatra chinensis]|uniref:WAP domain-containing protein n=1 Tax=Ranatra chinensis TaxID=642074 RepID=A0ABD0Y7H8_9HEMI
MFKPLPGLGPLTSCPPPTPVQVCDPTCADDQECAGIYKCCPTACGGAICTLPVTASRSNRVKPGSCPAKKSGPWICSNMCSTDADCRGNLKCCPNRCGALVCTAPE